MQIYYANGPSADPVAIRRPHIAKIILPVSLFDILLLLLTERGCLSLQSSETIFLCFDFWIGDTKSVEVLGSCVYRFLSWNQEVTCVSGLDLNDITFIRLAMRQILQSNQSHCVTPSLLQVEWRMLRKSGYEPSVTV